MDPVPLAGNTFDVRVLHGERLRAETPDPLLAGQQRLGEAQEDLRVALKLKEIK